MEGALVLAGVVVSFLVEVFKNKYQPSSSKTLAFVALLAVVGACGFYFLNFYGLLQSFIQIAVTAGAFYAFVLRTLKY